MFDISIPWSVILLMSPILMPFLSIPSALFAGYGWYRRKRNVYAALVVGLVAAFVVPWLALAAVALTEALHAWGRRASMTSIGIAWLVGALAIVGLVLWGASHAGSRKRDRG